jgi:type IV secretory pathway TrbL component
MVLNTLIYIALVIIVIIVIVVLLRFLFGVLFIMPTTTGHQVGMLPVIRGIPSSSLIQYNPSASNIDNVL